MMVGKGSLRGNEGSEESLGNSDVIGGLGQRGDSTKEEGRREIHVTACNDYWSLTWTDSLLCI